MEDSVVGKLLYWRDDDDLLGLIVHCDGSNVWVLHPHCTKNLDSWYLNFTVEIKDEQRSNR